MHVVQPRRHASAVIIRIGPGNSAHVADARGWVWAVVPVGVAISFLAFITPEGHNKFGGTLQYFASILLVLLVLKIIMTIEDDR